MLPVSGAEQLKTCEDQWMRPIASQSGAYSTFVSPGPCVVGGGRNRFQSPAARAFACRSRSKGTSPQRPASATCS
jgi:hypothetical protein